MWSLFKKRAAECRAFQGQLEDGATALPAATEVAELFLPLSVELKAHAAHCPECRAAAENLLRSRALLKALPSNAQLVGPWFAPRVMAAIAARGAELARIGDAWTVVPRLASKLTWASAIALLLASTWLYQKPQILPPLPASADITGSEPFSEIPPADNDEVLASLGEQAR